MYKGTNRNKQNQFEQRKVAVYDMAPNVGQGQKDVRKKAFNLMADEMSEEEVLARARARRGGNRTVLTKVENEAHKFLKEEILNRQRLETLAESLREKLELVKSLDETIIKKCKVEDIEHEIEESHDINERAIVIRLRIMDALAETNSDNSDNKGNSTETNAGGSGSLNTGNPGDIGIQDPSQRFN